MYMHDKKTRPTVTNTYHHGSVFFCSESYGGKREEEQEGEHQELQDLDPRGSPHIEEKVIDGNVDLDLLSLFPQELARIIGGIDTHGGTACSFNGAHALATPPRRE